MMPPERPRINFLPPTDVRHRNVEMPSSAPLLEAVKALVTAAGRREAFETNEFFSLSLERPDSLPLHIDSWKKTHPVGDEKRHVSVAQVVYRDYGSEEHPGGFVCDPDITLTETGNILQVKHLYEDGFLALNEKGRLRTDITAQEAQRAESVASSFARHISPPEWLEAAAAYKAEQITNKPFPVISISRAILKEQGFSEEQVSTLTDSDMEQIASRLEDTYRENGFFDDLEAHTTFVLEEKETT